MFLVSKTPLRFADFDGLMARKFDVRARGFLALLRLAGGQGAAPSGARFAPLRVVIPQPLGWVGLCQRQGVRFARPRNPRYARPAGCAWLRVAPGGP